jgi:hypothetical protein
MDSEIDFSEEREERDARARRRWERVRAVLVVLVAFGTYTFIAYDTGYYHGKWEAQDRAELRLAAERKAHRKELRDTDAAADRRVDDMRTFMEGLNDRSRAEREEEIQEMISTVGGLDDALRQCEIQRAAYRAVLTRPGAR